MKSLRSAVPRHGPFRPANWQRQKKQRANVRNHECAAAMRRGLAGETKKIAEANRRTGDREDDADTRSPFHLFLAFVVHPRFTETRPREPSRIPPSERNSSVLPVTF